MDWKGVVIWGWLATDVLLFFSWLAYLANKYGDKTKEVK